MKTLSYSGETMLTSDRMGDAVVDYARALASRNCADVVEIPTVDSHGVSSAQLLIGPTSQLVVLPAQHENVELADADAFASIVAKTEALGPSQAIGYDPAPWDQSSIELDFL